MEVWKDIQGFEGYYQVSSLGNVRSVTRFVRNPKGGLKKLIGNLMTNYDTALGYKSVTLRNSGRKVAKVHRLVAIAFIENPENKKEVNHKNGIKTDNRVENLEWCTNKENIHHSIATGLRVSTGENNPCSKLTEKQVLEIRENKDNLNQNDLAIIYGTNKANISKIKRRTRWKHI